MNNSTIHSEMMKIDKELRDLREAYIEKMRHDPLYHVLQTRKTELVQDCELTGHVKGNFHSNGLGYSWFYCSNCGTRFDIKED